MKQRGAIFEPDDLLTTSDVAKRADASPDVVRWWERSGKLPAIRIGHNQQRLFRRADVEEFLARRRERD